MSTQIKEKEQTTLSIDKKTKNLALNKAKKQHMSVSAVARILLRDYALGNIEIHSKSVVRDENGFTKEASENLDKIIQEAQDPKNLSPVFNNMEDAIAYLHK